MPLDLRREHSALRLIGAAFLGHFVVLQPAMAYGTIFLVAVRDRTFSCVF